MDLTSEKNWIKVALDNIEDIDLIKSIKALLLKGNLENAIVNEDEKPLTVEEYTKDIDEGIAEVERGEFYTRDEVKKILGEW